MSQHGKNPTCTMPMHPRMWQQYTCPDCNTKWHYEGQGIWKGEGGELL